MNTKLDRDTSPTDPEVLPSTLDHRALAMRIKRSVRRHAGSGVRALEVLVATDVIRLRGRCGSFYCKQLAQTAAMRLSSGVAVVNEIEVDE